MTTRNTQLRLDREAGLTIAELETKYGIKRQRVYAIFKATGGTPERPKRPSNPTGRSRRLISLANLLREGTCDKTALAALFGVSASTIERDIATLEAIKA